jgi:hypothetical protein
VSQAKQRGVRLNGTGDFAADQETAVQAVRICIGPPRNRAVLEDALWRLTRIVQGTPELSELIV